MFSFVLFAAFLTACGTERVNNSNNTVKSSTPAPVPASTPAPQSDLAGKLIGIKVSDSAPTGGKSNVQLLTEDLSNYKKDYRADPANAAKTLNNALRTFRDDDVKNQLLEIKDLAFAEVTNLQREGTAPEKANVEKIVADDIGQIRERLGAIDQKIDKNDFPRIATVLLIQTVVLGILIAASCLWLSSGMLNFTHRRNKPSGYKTVAELSAQKPRTPESTAVDLSKIEGNLTTILNSVDELNRRVTGYETEFRKNFDEQQLTSSTSEIKEPREQPSAEGAQQNPNPRSVEDLKLKYKGRCRPLEKEKFSNALVLSHGEGTFLMIEIQKDLESAYYIFPNKGRFRNGDEYRNIEHYFDCDSAGAGELLIEKLGRVKPVGDRWELQIKGKISIP